MPGVLVGELDSFAESAEPDRRQANHPSAPHMSRTLSSDLDLARQWRI